MPDTAAPAQNSLYSHKKDGYEVKVLETLPPAWNGWQPVVKFRRTAETTNGNFKKLRQKKLNRFLEEFAPRP